MDKRILVMGVGNILLQDEGVGVRVVEALENEYDFSDNVTILDGGTLGLKLTDYLTRCDFAIIVDAVLGDGPPGSIYRLVGDDLRRSIAFKSSMHDLDLCETMACCELIGHRPDAVVVGVEPENFREGMSVDLTDTVNALLPDIIDKVLEEIRSAGGVCTPKKTQTDVVS